MSFFSQPTWFSQPAWFSQSIWFSQSTWFSQTICTRRCRLLLCGLALFLASAARAETLYQVELIVFARDGAGVEAEERWRNDYRLRYPERLTALQESAEGSAPFQRLPAAALQLKREAALLGQRKNMRVLFHGAWQQPADDAARATSVFISGGQAFGEHHELEGFVTLSAERYLHIDTNLWLSRFAPNGGADAPALPKAPFAIQEGGQVLNGYAPDQIYVLQEQRRMRSGELHYQDHPRLGTLVLITPAGAAQGESAGAAN